MRYTWLGILSYSGPLRVFLAEIWILASVCTAANGVCSRPLEQTLFADVIEIVHAFHEIVRKAL